MSDAVFDTRRDADGHDAGGQRHAFCQKHGEVAQRGEADSGGPGVRRCWCRSAQSRWKRSATSYGGSGGTSCAGGTEGGALFTFGSAPYNLELAFEDQRGSYEDQRRR